MQFIHFCGKGFVIKCNGEESECILPYFGLDVATMWLSYFAKKNKKKMFGSSEFGGVLRTIILYAKL